MCIQHKCITDFLEITNKGNNVFFEEVEVLISYDICLVLPRVPIPEALEYLKDRQSYISKKIYEQRNQTVIGYFKNIKH